MNNDIFSGNWKQFKGEVKKQWGKLTDDQLDQIEGNREKLVGKIQENYGVAREEAEKLIGVQLGVSRAQLPELAASEFYIQDLIGMKVQLTDGSDFGTIKRVFQVF